MPKGDVYETKIGEKKARLVVTGSPSKFGTKVKWLTGPLKTKEANIDKSLFKGFERAKDVEKVDDVQRADGGSSA